MTSRFKCASLRASSRKHSEDRVEAIERDDVLVVVVADGAGGLAGGATAADAVVEAVRVAVDDDGVDITDTFSWNNVLIAVDKKLAAKLAGETTAIVLVVSPAGVVGASVGDSQAWIVLEDGIDDLTAGQNRKRLGSGRAAPVMFTRPRLDGILIVGTDGVFNYTTAEKIVQAVRDREPGEAVVDLRALVQLPSRNYSDDVGVVVVAPGR